uniref:HSR domain-containing protein n=1 Tax=Urocitellus parryii TaxID=9999 RepID=A0A8D2H3X8_UROPR
VFGIKKEQLLHEYLFRHFKENKVEIASAITKLFPFLMSLRDRAFISQQMFDHLQEACRNLVPVNAVVYTVLSELEKTFSLSLLNELFSHTNLTAYPDLVEISRSFLNGDKLTHPTRCSVSKVEKVILRENQGGDC